MFQLRMVFQTQMPISLVILIISIQDLYMTKYKYTIIANNMHDDSRLMNGALTFTHICIDSS